MYNPVGELRVTPDIPIAHVAPITTAAWAESKAKLTVPEASYGSTAIEMF